MIALEEYLVIGTWDLQNPRGTARAEKASEMEFTKKACSLGSNGQEYSTMVTSRDKVSNLIKIYKVTFFK